MNSIYVLGIVPGLDIKLGGKPKIHCSASGGFTVVAEIYIKQKNTSN